MSSIVALRDAEATLCLLRQRWGSLTSIDLSSMAARKPYREVWSAVAARPVDRPDGGFLPIEDHLTDAGVSGVPLHAVRDLQTTLGAEAPDIARIMRDGFSEPRSGPVVDASLRALAAASLKKLDLALQG